MTDRIADPWGARTPYAPGTPWPERADVQLEDGLEEREVERWVPNSLDPAFERDAIDIAVRDGRIAGVRGRAQTA